MNVGISTACTAFRLETEDGVNLISSLGADCMEVYLKTFYEYRPEFAKKYAQNAEGVKVSSLRVLPSDFEPHLFFRTRRTRGDGFYWLDQIMRSAQLFGAENYCFHGFIRAGEGLDDINFFAERLREASEFCSRYGVRLCLENQSFGLFNRPQIFKELANNFPELACAFNLEQALRSGYPYAMYLAKMQGRISQASVCDRSENGAVCLPGEGVFDFEEIFKRLKDAGFDGSVIINCGDRGDEKALKACVEHLKEIIYKI